MNEGSLPEGWLKAKLGDVCSKVTDGSHNPPKGKESGKPMLSAKNIHHGLVDFSESFRFISEEEFETENARTRVSSGDVLLTIVGALGRTAVVPDNVEPFSLQRSVAVLSSPRMNSFCFRYAMESYEFQKQIIENAKGTAQKGIYLKKLKSLELTVPPLAEQKAIAEKLDTLLAKVESTKARLERIPKILKRFRQSVLAAAVSGKLTEEWRESKGVRFPYEECDFSEIIIEMRNGLSPKPNEDGKGKPILRISSVRPFSLDQVDIRFLDVSDKDEERYSLVPGDLLFTRYNGSIDFVGVCALVRRVDHCALLYPDKLIRVRADLDKVIPAYIEIFSASYEAREYINSLVKSTSGQKGISGKDLKMMKVKLPTVTEQTEIVRRVDQLFAYADTIETQVNNALERVNNLTQSILAKAFRGELTEQWRKDNPDLISGENSASALLEKIKAERAAAKPVKKAKAKARKG